MTESNSPMDPSHPLYQKLYDLALEERPVRSFTEVTSATSKEDSMLGSPENSGNSMLLEMQILVEDLILISLLTQNLSERLQSQLQLLKDKSERLKSLLSGIKDQSELGSGLIRALNWSSEPSKINPLGQTLGQLLQTNMTDQEIITVLRSISG